MSEIEIASTKGPVSKINNVTRTGALTPHRPDELSA
jgi:hypothetical protein